MKRMPKGQFLEHLVSAGAKGGEDGTELKLVRVEETERRRKQW